MLTAPSPQQPHDVRANGDFRLCKNHNYKIEAAWEATGATNAGSRGSAPLDGRRNICLSATLTASKSAKTATFKIEKGIAMSNDRSAARHGRGIAASERA